MKYKSTHLLFILGLFIISCSKDPIKRIIKIDSVEQDITEISANIKDSSIIDYLDIFRRYKSYDYFLKTTQKERNDGWYLLVNKEQFEKIADEFFKDLKKNKYTYEHFVNHLTGKEVTIYSIKLQKKITSHAAKIWTR